MNKENDKKKYWEGLCIVSCCFLEIYRILVKELKFNMCYIFVFVLCYVFYFIVFY